MWGKGFAFCVLRFALCLVLPDAERCKSKGKTQSAKRKSKNPKAGCTSFPVYYLRHATRQLPFPAYRIPHTTYHIPDTRHHMPSTAYDIPSMSSVLSNIPALKG